MNKMKTWIAAALSVCLFAGGAVCVHAAQEDAGYQGIQVESPEWVGNLDAAESADQMLVVAAFNETATDAWVSLHEK